MSNNITILSAATEGWQKLTNLTWPTHRDYVERHGYNLKHDIIPKNYQHQPAWYKLEMILNWFNQATPDAYAWWLDADAMFTGDRPAPHYPNTDLLISKDQNGINSGSFILSNSLASRKLITEALGLASKYNNHPWFEQAALMELLSNGSQPDLKVTYVPMQLFNSAIKDWKPGDLIIHAAGCGMVSQRVNALLNRKIKFAHAGDFGDIIYSLPTIKAIAVREGPQDVTLFNSPHTTHRMTKEQASLIEPLLLSQPYIKSVSYSDKHCNSDFNQFRDISNEGWQPKTLADQHLMTLGKGTKWRNSIWLQVEEPITDFPVLFHRSVRYRNDKFPWQKIRDRYPEAVFVGLPDEHILFCREFGQVPYVPTPNLLELAQLIAGCKLFVGNQSCPFAIAEGLKKTAILEVCPWTSNCNFSRINVIHGSNSDFELPLI